MCIVAAGEGAGRSVACSLCHSMNAPPLTWGGKLAAALAGYGNRQRRREDAPPSSMICHCTWLPQQRCQRLCAGSHELSTHCECSLMPPDSFCSREDRQPRVVPVLLTPVTLFLIHDCPQRGVHRRCAMEHIPIPLRLVVEILEPGSPKKWHLGVPSTSCCRRIEPRTLRKL